MSKTFYQPDEHIAGMTVICIAERSKWISHTTYHMRCDCGHQFIMGHGAIYQKQKAKRTKCAKCKTQVYFTGKTNNRYPELAAAVNDLAFIDAHWIPTVPPRPYIWGQQG